VSQSVAVLRELENLGSWNVNSLWMSVMDATEEEGV
jgi:hypothetical protein